MQVSGFFTSEDNLPDFRWQLFNERGGDGFKLALAHETIKSISQHGLSHQAASVGTYLAKKLIKLDGVQDVNSLGSQIGFGLGTQENNVRVLKTLKAKGVAVQAAGPTRIALNPSLVFERKHADEFIKVLKKALRE